MRAKRQMIETLAILSLLVLSATNVAAQSGYVPVWRSGSGAQFWRSGMSIDEFKAQDKTYYNQGLRLADVSIAGGKFTALWRPGSGAQWWRSGMSSDEMKAQDKTYFDQGLRLTALKNVDGKLLAVWRPGSGAQWWRSGMSSDEMKAQDKTYFDQGLRLTTLQVTDGNYLAVWRPGSGAQWWRSGMSFDEFKTQDQTYFGQGLRLTELQVAGGKYAAVWRPGSGAQYWYSPLCFDDFKTEDEAYFKKGLRLEQVGRADGPRALYKLPFEDDGAWVLSNGNWDDPKHGHNQGNPNGLQAYAFDFVHDADHDGKGESGQKILAARGGKVYAFVESESGNSWGSKDPCKPGVGNYLVIDHADGTFGVYWHLAQNGVLVKLGDNVKTGDHIATSDNTGNSSTPHLHFDVRSGWDLKYTCSNLSESPNVKILLQDKNHECWRPRVGDSLASNNH